MNQSISRTLLIGVALGSLVAGVLVVLGLRAASPAIRIATLERQLDAIDHAACEAAPDSWGWASGDMSFFAYDRAGRSANPEAPPVEGGLLRQAVGEGEVAVERSANRIVFVVPHAADGPCAVIRVTTSSLEPAVAPRLLGILTVAVVVAMIFAVFGTFWLLVRPLRSRIEGLAVAARSVGSESFAEQPGGSDALAKIADVLARSHGRIVEAQDALEERNRALEQHLAGIAHDLRTPLSSMHLALEALATQSTGEVQREARRALADAVYLSSMVENLHEATRLRHEVDITSDSVELSDLVRRLEKRFAIVGRYAGVEVAASMPEEEVWVACRPALAERAVANVVQNAVEHNSEPGHVAVTLSLIDSGRRFELLIADDGPGLPDKTMASLQNETFLVDDARPRGPGMGMLITTEVAKRAGWSVSYEALDPTGLQVRLEGPVMESRQ